MNQPYVDNMYKITPAGWDLIDQAFKKNKGNQIKDHDQLSEAIGILACSLGNASPKKMLNNPILSRKVIKNLSQKEGLTEKEKKERQLILKKIFEIQLLKTEKPITEVYLQSLLQSLKEEEGWMDDPSLSTQILKVLMSQPPSNTLKEIFKEIKDRNLAFYVKVKTPTVEEKEVLFTASELREQTSYFDHLHSYNSPSDLSTTNLDFNCIELDPDSFSLRPSDLNNLLLYLSGKKEKLNEIVKSIGPLHAYRLFSEMRISGAAISIEREVIDSLRFEPLSTRDLAHLWENYGDRARLSCIAYLKNHPDFAIEETAENKRFKEIQTALTKAAFKDDEARFLTDQSNGILFIQHNDKSLGIGMNTTGFNRSLQSLDVFLSQAKIEPTAIGISAYHFEIPNELEEVLKKHPSIKHIIITSAASFSTSEMEEYKKSINAFRDAHPGVLIDLEIYQRQNKMLEGIYHDIN